MTMHENFIKIADEAFKEKLNEEDFMKAFKANPSLFCALRMDELKLFAEGIVRECADRVSNDENAFDILKHFGIEE